MGTNAGVCGIFGLRLAEFEDLSRDMREYVQDMQDEQDLAGDCEPVVDIVMSEQFQDKWLPRVRETLMSAGIELPNDVYIDWSGDVDERPARCATPPEEFLVGLDIFTKPWQWSERCGVSEWPESFIQKAAWHTWVWMG